MLQYISSKIDVNYELEFQLPNLSHMQVSPIEGRLLQLLIKMNNVKTIVELGTFLGYSATWMANSMDDGVLYTIEGSDKYASLARKNLCKFPNVRLMIGDAREKLLELSEYNCQFDMIFIDCNKSGYPDYLIWAEENIRSGGLIVADNTLSFGDITIYDDECSGKSYERMREFNDMLADSVKYDSIIIPTIKGLTVAIKKF